MFSFTRSSVSVLVLSAAVASAQNILSQKCQSTLLTIALNPQASSCLNTQSVMSIVLDSKKALADPVGTLNTWVTGMCGGDYCSDQTLSDITKNVSAGCSDEFAYRGYDIKTDLSSVIAQVQQVYPTARNISCLTETPSNQFCVSTTLDKTIKSYSSDGSIEAAVNTIKDAINAKSVPANLKDSCTPCAKAAWSTVRKDFPAVGNYVDGTLDGICGADFTDGAMPATVVMSTLATKKSAALGMSTSTGLQIATVAFTVLSLVI